MTDGHNEAQEFPLRKQFDSVKPVNGSGEKITSEIGDVMPAGHPNAGWIYMGSDDETGKDFFASPTDEMGTFNFIPANVQAAIVNARIPSVSQLVKMYRNKEKGALKGSFNESETDPRGTYWGITKNRIFGHAAALRFINGNQLDYLIKVNVASLRCVR